MVMRAFDDRWTTIRSEMIKLTTTPTSTSQTIEKMNVSVIRVKSTHAPILSTVIHLERVPKPEKLTSPPVVNNIGGYLDEEGDHHQANAATVL
jgi:hypothetical protein